MDYDSMHFDPMNYFLIWLCGESGWHIGMKTGEKRKTKFLQNLSMREYLRYKTSVRDDSSPDCFNLVPNSGKLSQQLIDDYYYRREGTGTNL